MTELGIHWERDDLGGGQFRHVQNIKPICYRDGTIVKRISSDWSNSGNPTYPHIVADAGFQVAASNTGIMRYFPTRDQNVWFEIGDPVYRDGGVVKTFDFSNPTRQGNWMLWEKPAADFGMRHIGHAVKLGMEIKTAYRPDNREFAFPLTYNGVVRQGRNMLVDGDIKMRMRPFVAYDYAYDGDDRETVKVPHEFRTVAGQEYVVITLPIEMDSMTRPVLDPTLELQPAAAAGIDTRIYGQVGWENYNFGVSDPLPVGNIASFPSKILYKFDISSIPGGSTIDSASLALVVASWTGANSAITSNNSLVEFYEGDADGANPSGDGSTWNHRNYNGSVAWSGGAGGGSGSDYDATPSDSQAVNAPSGTITWNVKSIVESWMSTNYGMWMVTTISATIRFYSSDNGTASNRPKLTINYTTTGGVAPIMDYYRRRRIT